MAIMLHKARPNLLKEWDYIKNKGLNPKELSPGSEKRVWWLCRKCSFSWNTCVFSRAGLSKKEISGCPACCGRSVSEKNNLLVNFPKLCHEWDIELNSILPNQIYYGSTKKVWWACAKGKDHKWKASVRRRALMGRGCPFCAGRKVSDTNRLSTIYPDLVKDWDFCKNRNEPREIVVGSGKMVWWKCYICNYSWKTRVNHRTKYSSGCPCCSGFVVSDSNRLSIFYPELLKEWDYNKNSPLTPHDVTVRSTKKVYWVCCRCKYGWESFVYSRTGGTSSGCPRCCSGLSATYNLLYCYPEIAKDWHPNNKETPDKVYPKAAIRAHWLCHVCFHEWQAYVFNRTSDTVTTVGNGCPLCSKAGVSKVSQKWLDFLNISILCREVPLYIGNKRLIVDAYISETNTIYEFLGDYWHGNPEIFNKNEIHPAKKILYGELYIETMERLDLFRKQGYKVIYIWEDDWKRLKKTSNHKLSLS